MTGAMTSETMSLGLLRVLERFSQAKGVCKHLGNFMRRISGGAVWSNRPRTDLARASVEQSAGATLPIFRISFITLSIQKTQYLGGIPIWISSKAISF